MAIHYVKTIRKTVFEAAQKYQKKRKKKDILSNH